MRILIIIGSLFVIYYMLKRIRETNDIRKVLSEDGWLVLVVRVAAVVIIATGIIETSVYIVKEQVDYHMTVETIKEYYEVFIDEEITEQEEIEKLKEKYYNDKKIGNTGYTQKQWIDLMYKGYILGDIAAREENTEMKMEMSKFKEEKLNIQTRKEIGKLVIIGYKQGDARKYAEMYNSAKINHFNNPESYIVKNETKEKIHRIISREYKVYKERSSTIVSMFGSRDHKTVDLTTMIALDIAMDNGIFEAQILDEDTLEPVDKTVDDFDLTDEHSLSLYQSYKIEINGEIKTIEMWLDLCYDEALYVVTGVDDFNISSLNSIAD